jgi:uncharacterized coiled-coil protein SlyX
MMVGFNHDEATLFVGGPQPADDFGNVGIATSTPSARLHVERDASGESSGLYTTARFNMVGALGSSAVNEAVNVKLTTATGSNTFKNNAVIVQSEGANKNYAGTFNAITTSETGTNQALLATASGNGTSTSNVGIEARAGLGARAYGVFAHAVDASVANYGVYSTASGTNAWAGWFNGATHCTAGVWTSSDENLKTNVEEIVNASEILAAIQVATYQFNQDAAEGLNLPEGQHWGVIAQQLETVLPELVKEVVFPTISDSDDEDFSEDFSYKSVNYTELIPILIAGHKEQQSTIEAQNAKLDEQAAEIEEMKDQISTLFEMVAACCEAGCAKSMNQPQGPKEEGMNYDLRIEQPYLGQNVPNPFMVETSITYRIPEQAMVRVRVMDAKGQQVDMLVDGLMPKGEYRIVWNASHLPAGLYFYTLEADGVELVKKAVKL